MLVVFDEFRSGEGCEKWQFTALSGVVILSEFDGEGINQRDMVREVRALMGVFLALQSLNVIGYELNAWKALYKFYKNHCWKPSDYNKFTVT